MKIAFLIGLLMLSVLLTQTAEARLLIGESIFVEEPSEEELFIIADEIKINAALANEFIGIGRKITAITEIEGDFIAIGLSVDFSGNAENDIYLIGNYVEVAGKVAGSITVLGKTVHIKGPVEGNLRAFAENIKIDGEIAGRTLLWGKDVALRGTFNDLVLYANNLSFSPTVHIAGDLTYNVPEEMGLAHIRIDGKKTWNKPFTDRVQETAPVTLIKRFYSFFSLLFPVLLMLGIFPTLFKETATFSVKSFLKSFGTGTIFIILTIIALPVIFITIVGAPLGLIVTSLFFSLVYISRVFPAIFVGRLILFKLRERTLTWVLATFIGIFLFTAISVHPTAKILLNIISIPTGFGALFLGRINLIKRLRKQQIL